MINAHQIDAVVYSDFIIKLGRKRNLKFITDNGKFMCKQANEF